MKNLIFCCMILFVFIIGCEKTTSPGDDSKIYGTILDPDGNPVEDAKILVNFNIDSEYPIGKNGINTSKGIDDPPVSDVNIIGNYPNPFISVTCIAFDLGTTCMLSLYIMNYYNEIVETIVDSQMYYAGGYNFNWNGKDNDNKNLQNGLYKVVFNIEDEIYSHTCFAFVDYNEFLCEDITPLCMSDNSGQFTVPSDDLPLNYIGDQYDENGNPVGDFTVTPYIDIWAFHPDYDAVHVDSILVESGKDINVSLSFE